MHIKYKNESDQTETPTSVLVDELDLKLASELEVDARQSYGRLAQKLGVIPATVRRRMQRLIDARAITIALTADPVAFGLQMDVLVGIKTATGKASAVADYLSSYPRVMAVMLTTGRYDLMIAAAFRERGEVFEFQDVVLRRAEDLLDAELMMVVGMFKNSWLYIHGDANASSGIQTRCFDKQDLELIKMLELNPRCNIKFLSKKLGMRRQLVGKRLQSLIDSKMINVSSILNPRVIGFGTQVIVLIKVYLGKINTVANALVAHNQVNHIVVTTGPYEIAMWIIVKDLNELTHFLKDDLSGIPGIVSYETMLIATLPKLSLKYLTD